MTMNKIYVIAGNEKEAKEWVLADSFRRFGAGDTSASLSDYVTIKDATQLIGLKEPHGVFIGTFRKRSDVKDIIANLIVRYEIGESPDTIKQLYKELCGFV